MFLNRQVITGWIASLIRLRVHRRSAFWFAVLIRLLRLLYLRLIFLSYYTLIYGSNFCHLTILFLLSDVYILGLFVASRCICACFLCLPLYDMVLTQSLYTQNFELIFMTKAIRIFKELHWFNHRNEIHFWVKVTNTIVYVTYSIGWDSLTH